MSIPNTTSPVKIILLVLCVLVNCSGLFVTIIGPDGALYATIAKTMVLKNNYLELFAEGKDWLDKPHLPFWITAFSFSVFGFTTWAYKLPAILFLLIGGIYTYAFSKKLYNKEVAYWSVIVLLTAEHIILSNNDVRAEPYLTCFIIASVYHFYLAHTRKQAGHLLAGALFAACAVMTKGMFALIPIGGAIAGELLIKKNWRDLFHIRWLMAAILILLFITPELYSLYYQFDAHPEKMVFGQRGVSGVRFFFWDSQFGRFFNTGPIKGKGDPFFFLHTLLWAFLPWSLLLYAALFQKIRRGFKNPAAQEWYTFFGGMVGLLLFSASRFQLPHYINIVFPFFAIIAANYVLSLRNERSLKAFNVVQSIIVIILLVLMVTLHFFFRPGFDISFIALGALMLATIVYFLAWRFILLKSAVAIITVNLYLNWVFYPALLKYQSGSEAAFFINKNYPGIPVVQLRNRYAYAMEFYLQAPLISIDSLPKLSDIGSPVILYVPGGEASMIPEGKLIRSFDDFHISRLTPKLLNEATRGEEVEKFNLYWVER